jgi:hypothetical protein
LPTTQVRGPAGLDTLDGYPLQLMGEKGPVGYHALCAQTENPQPGPPTKYVWYCATRKL